MMNKKFIIVFFRAIIFLDSLSFFNNDIGKIIAFRNKAMQLLNTLKGLIVSHVLPVLVVSGIK
jgi:hypothetical protein